MKIFSWFKIGEIAQSIIDDFDHSMAWEPAFKQFHNGTAYTFKEGNREYTLIFIDNTRRIQIQNAFGVKFSKWETRQIWAAKTKMILYKQSKVDNNIDVREREYLKKIFPNCILNDK